MLREEIEGALSQEGDWTLSAIHRMQKLDSFLKESQRLNHPGLCIFSPHLPPKSLHSFPLG